MATTEITLSSFSGWTEVLSVTGFVYADGIVRSEQSETEPTTSGTLRSAGEVVIKQPSESGSIWLKNNTQSDILVMVTSTASETADETNIYMGFLEDDIGSSEQSVNGSSSPVVFSTPVVPENKALVIARMMIYMEDTAVFSSEKFGGRTALINGWELNGNGETLAIAKDNKTLALFMFDLTGNTLFGKENRTLVGRFSFNKFVGDSDGFTVRAGEVLSTIVNDSLTGLTHLQVMAQGKYIDV